MYDLISREAAIEEFEDMVTSVSVYGESAEARYATNARIRFIEKLNSIPSVPAVPLDKLCELLAEMYHCPGSGWPSSNRACHPDCPDEAFEKLCGTDCDKHTDVERWKAFLTNWMEGLE